MYSFSMSLRAQDVSIYKWKYDKLHILVNILLNISHLHRAPVPRRLNDLRHQLRMTNRLHLLHHPHDGRLRLKRPVRRHTDMRLFVLLSRLFELDRVDLDAVFGVAEGRVQREGVGRGDFAAFGVFSEGTEARAGERLEGPLDFGVG